MIEAAERRFVLSRPQWAFWRARERYQDGEGGYRSGKTTVALLKVAHLAYEHPGMHWFIGRWTQDATDAQLKPRFVELCGHLIVNWISEESCFELLTREDGVYSRVYVRGLKPSEGTSPFSKVHGLTLAGAYLDQPEEIPEEYFVHMRTRLSQPGYPQMLILTPNPPDKNHWISREFPDDDSRRAEGYRYIRFTMRDNVAALGEEYVSRAERDLQASAPAEYRRAILGQRGVPMKGRPVYQGMFDEGAHVRPVEFNPRVPLIETLDFGHRHPAVTWLQFPAGELHILGGVMGENLFIEQFIPYVERIRSEWFPGLTPGLLWWTCDPAGDVSNSHGTRTAVQILRHFGIAPRIEPDANTPPRRTYAIQTLSAYLKRRRPDGSPVCAINPRFLLLDEHGTRTPDNVLVDGFSVGYVWDDDHAYAGTQYANLRRPKKDGWYEHPFNTLEYGMIAFAPPDAAEAVGLLRTPEAEQRARRLLKSRGLDHESQADVSALAAKIERARAEEARELQERRALREAQRDHDPDDAVLARRGAPRHRRGGY